METPTNGADIERAVERHATFTRRFRAALVDAAVVSAGMILIVIVGDATDSVPGSGRLA